MSLNTGTEQLDNIGIYELWPSAGNVRDQDFVSQFGLCVITAVPISLGGCCYEEEAMKSKSWRIPNILVTAVMNNTIVSELIVTRATSILTYPRCTELKLLERKVHWRSIHELCLCCSCYF